MKTYIIHATVNYEVEQKETGERYKATQRPTLSVEASSKKAALNKAKKEREKAIGTEWWPVVWLSLRADLVTVI